MLAWRRLVDGRPWHGGAYFAGRIGETEPAGELTCKPVPSPRLVVLVVLLLLLLLLMLLMRVAAVNAGCGCATTAVCAAVLVLLQRVVVTLLIR